MPDYNNFQLMRGPLVKMTVGNYIYGQDGILNSLSYTIPNDSPWEINIAQKEGYYEGRVRQIEMTIGRQK